MTYLKGVAIGFIAIVACIALFYEAVGIFFFYDGRYLMGRFWFISLPLMSFVFAIGFYLTVRKYRAARLSKVHPGSL
jgi:uncharacterized membrane protein